MVIALLYVHQFCAMHVKTELALYGERLIVKSSVRYGSRHTEVICNGGLILLSCSGGVRTLIDIMLP